MAIAKPPARRPKTQEVAVDRFIAGAHAKAKSATTKRAPVERTPVMLRLDEDLLSAIDDAARRRGLTRSSWIRMSLVDAVNAEKKSD